MRTMSTPTLKIDSLADFEALLQNTVCINSLSRYGNCRFTVRSWLPWLTKEVRVYSDSIQKVWPQAEAIIGMMGNFSIAATKERGVDLLKEAFKKTRTESSEPFWMFEEGFFWHSEIEGMKYLPESLSVVIETKQRGTFTTPFKLVKENNYKVASFLMQTHDMGLSSRTTFEALDLCGVVNLPRARSAVHKVPDSVADILSITRVHPSSTEVEIIMKSATTDELQVCSCDLAKLNMVFPYFMQAMLTTNEAFNCDEIVRASYLREWWRHLHADKNEPLLFSVGESWANYTYFDYGPVFEASGATVHMWSDLISAGLDGDPRIAFTFASNSQDMPVYCTIGKGGSQYNLLGLDKIVSMLTALDINGPEAAGPFYRALCGEAKSNLDFPAMNMDGHTFL